MKTFILLYFFLVIAGCSGLPSNEADLGNNTENTLHADNCCAHSTGSYCAHELIPGCSNTTSTAAPDAPFVPITSPASNNCAHIGADGTCYHPM